MTDDSYTVKITMPRYLDATKSVAINGDTRTLATLMLLGGDATNNEEIDVNDATTIGGAYGTRPGYRNVSGMRMPI